MFKRIVAVTGLLCLASLTACGRLSPVLTPEQIQETYLNDDISQKEFEKNIDEDTITIEDKESAEEEFLRSQIEKVSVYQQLLEAYRDVVCYQKEWHLEYSMGDPAFYRMFYYADAGYCIADLDTDGFPELLIGCTDQETWNGVIYDLYTYHAGDVKKILESTERSRFRLLKDGRIAHEQSGGADAYVIEYYTFESGDMALSQTNVSDAGLPQTIIYTSFSQLPSYLSFDQPESFPTAYTYTGSGGSRDHYVAANPMLFWNGTEYELIPYLRECGLGEFGYMYTDESRDVCNSVSFNLGNLEIRIHGTDEHYLQISTPHHVVYIETGKRGDLFNATSSLLVSHDTLDALFRIMPYMVSYNHEGCPLAGTGINHYSYSGDLRIKHTDFLDTMIFNNVNTTNSSDQTGDPYNPSAVDPGPFWEGESFFDINAYLTACGGWHVGWLMSGEDDNKHYAGACCDFDTTSLSIYGITDYGTQTHIKTKHENVFMMGDAVTDKTPIRISRDHELFMEKGQLEILFQIMPRIVDTDSEECPFAGLGIKHYGSTYHDD